MRFPLANVAIHGSLLLQTSPLLVISLFSIYIFVYRLLFYLSTYLTVYLSIFILIFLFIYCSCNTYTIQMNNSPIHHTKEPLHLLTDMRNKLKLTRLHPAHDINLKREYAQGRRTQENNTCINTNKIPATQCTTRQNTSIWPLSCAVLWRSSMCSCVFSWPRLITRCCVHTLYPADTNV